MFKNKKSGTTQNMNIDTLIGEHCALQGNISSQNSIRIDGGIVGNVASEGMIVIGEKGWIKGNAQTKELVVYGRIEGDVMAQNLDLKASAHISGCIDTHSLQVEPGAVYQGKVTMHSKNITALPDDISPTKSLSSSSVDEAYALPHES